MDLAQFHQSEVPAVASVAVVPVGLTRFRPPDDTLKPVEPADATNVIALVQQLQAQYQDQLGTTFIWLADEWFLMAGQDLPSASHYKDYPQIDNGVGSIRQFLSQFEHAAQHLPSHISTPKRLTWVVGNTVEKAFQPIVQRLNQIQGLSIKLAPLRSEYWGQTMTVTGLLTGQDILTGLQHHPLGDALLLPTLMLKYGTTQFLDDMTVSDLAHALNIAVIPIQGGIDDVVRACLQ